MATSRRQIEVGLLRIGLYVSQLDRPWLETPFLFQGFCIRTESEIEELQRYCEYVEIDIEQSDATLQQTLSAPTQTEPVQHHVTSRKRSLWQRFLGLFRGGRSMSDADNRRPGDFYHDTVSTSAELVVAKALHTGLHDQLMNFLDGIRHGKTMSMPDMEVVTGALVDSVLRNSTAMSLLVRMQKKDEYAGTHSLATSVWALVFGRHLGLDREALAAAGLGGLLLDVGKIKLPTEMLNKNGPLTNVERAHMQTHVEHSLEIIRQGGSVDQRVLDMVATHHERFDGSGYPKGLKGSQIPVFGRIGGIVDSYSAMTSTRAYAEAMSSYDAMREFTSLSDTLFRRRWSNSSFRLFVSSR
jgi:HD-GYP domain-containing protein (c-di-GMP phosphodiesterase class II)